MNKYKKKNELVNYWKNDSKLKIREINPLIFSKLTFIDTIKNITLGPVYPISLVRRIGTCIYASS
ncbi:hypothetical protein BpHYR1_010814 [Brachionus plicatilis]|uniref:Uncharacterized protein n=1 Tax=Brachionus plicatilis TaxID=10195 RepID=A0A3M7QG39_BRAPC|nr:hypothetical protein BpHYR1_010814 [Brachionus plicatilis]